MDDLVQRLSAGTHPVEVKIRPEPTIDRLRECLDRGYVHIKFTETRGGTELGVALDRAASQWTEEQLAAQSGTIRLDGDLTLNFVKVRCTADIDLRDFSGQGRLTPVEAP